VFEVDTDDGNDAHVAAPVTGFDPSDVVALELAAIRLSNASGAEQPMARSRYVLSIPENGRQTTDVFWLTPSGKRIAEFISD
jgi:hypothetical protein